MYSIFVLDAIFCCIATLLKDSVAASSVAFSSYGILTTLTEELLNSGRLLFRTSWWCIGWTPLLMNTKLVLYNHEEPREQGYNAWDLLLTFYIIKKVERNTLGS